MARETLAQLRKRIAELEAELDRVRSESAALRPAPLAQGPERAPRRRLGRRIVAGVLVVLGVVLTPVALLVQFADAQLTDTDRFVATYAPLAEAPAVQDAVATAIVDGIESAIDFDAVIGGVFDGIRQLGLGDEVAAGLELFRGAAVEGVKGGLAQLVDGLVTSEVFPAVWEQTIRVTHDQLNATLRGEARALGAVADDTIAIQLGPVLDFARGQLAENGLGFVAQFLPEGADVAIPVAEVSGIGQVRALYALAVALGVWLPIVAALLLVVGIAVAPSRRRWALGASIALGAVAALLGIALGIGRSATTAAELLGPDALGVLYDTAVGPLAGTVFALGAIAFVGIVTAWLLGPSRTAAATRRALDHGPAIVRRRLALTNPASRFLERHRTPILWLVAGAVVVTVVFFRPLTIGVVIVAVVVGGALLVLVELLRTQSASAASAEEPLADATAEDLAEDVAR